MANGEHNGEASPEPIEIDVGEVSEKDEALSVHRLTHRDLLKTAREHLDSGRYQEAILIAQAGAEACAASAVWMLLDRNHARYRELLLALAFDRGDNYSLMGGRAQEVWTFITGGDAIQQSGQVWTDYGQHIKRRNDVAHKTAFGLTKADAEDSLRAVNKFVEHVEQVTERVLGPGVW